MPTCPFCLEEIEPEEAKVFDEEDGTPAHKECSDLHGGYLEEL